MLQHFLSNKLNMLNHTLLFKSLGSVRFLKKNYFTFLYIYIYIYIYILSIIMIMVLMLKIQLCITRKK